MGNIGQILFILFLVFLNGFFVATEAALLRVRKTQIDVLKNKRNRLARLIQIAQNNMGLYISATQFGNTVTSIALGSLGLPIVEKIFSNLFTLHNGLSFLNQASIIVFLSFIILTLFNLIFGELFPKAVAIRKPIINMLIFIVPLYLFVHIFLPIIKCLNWVTNSFLKIIGIHQTSHEHAYSEEEIHEILKQSNNNNHITETEKIIATNAFKLKNIQIKSLMNGKRISEPGYDQNVIYINENQNADDLLIQMRKQKIHLAVILDKSNRKYGVVTFNDIVSRLIDV